MTTFRWFLLVLLLILWFLFVTVFLYIELFMTHIPGEL